MERDEDIKMYLKPSKFYRDEEGHYWESRGVFGGKSLLMPAPIWAGNINPYLFEGPNIIIKSHHRVEEGCTSYRRRESIID